MSTTSTNSLERKLIAFFKEMASAKEINNYESDRGKFVFHMTDWQEALGSLDRLFNCPDDYDQEQANHVLQELFYHVLPHLNAAAEIYLGMATASDAAMPQLSSGCNTWFYPGQKTLQTR